MPVPIEGRGSYRRTGNNVYHIENVWQNAPAHLAENGPRGLARVRRGVQAYPYQEALPDRLGAIATLFAMIGWLMILAALAVSSISLLQPVLVEQLGTPNVLGGVAGSLFVGLLTVSIGLAARAQFDQAKATFDQLNAAFDQAAAARELVAMERARMGVEQY